MAGAGSLLVPSPPGRSSTEFGCSGQSASPAQRGNRKQTKLPHAEKATVEREKIVDYLLNPAHPDNAGVKQNYD